MKPLAFKNNPADPDGPGGLRKQIEDYQRMNGQTRMAYMRLLCESLIEMLGPDAAEWQLVEESSFEGSKHTTTWRFERRNA